MRDRRWPISLKLPVTVALATLLAMVATGGGYAMAAQIRQTRSTSGSSLNNFLEGVAVSGSSAWAVGYYSAETADQTLIESWNGASWVIQPSPDPGGPSQNSRLWARQRYRTRWPGLWAVTHQPADRTR